MKPLNIELSYAETDRGKHVYKSLGLNDAVPELHIATSSPPQKIRLVVTELNTIELRLPERHQERLTRALAANVEKILPDDPKQARCFLIKSLATYFRSTGCAEVAKHVEELLEAVT